MKNSKEYSKKVADYYKSVKKNAKKAEVLEFESPIHAMVFGAVCEHYSHSDAAKALAKMEDHFVDWNDLRVSRAEEITEVLGGGAGVSAKVASQLTSILQKVFDNYDSVTLDPVIEFGKRQARQVLEEMGSFNLFVLNFIMLKVMKAHSLPMTEQMLKYVRENDLVHPDADEKDIISFLERQISADDMEAFYMMLREDSEKKPVKKASTKKVTKKKAATKKKATKKAAKKVTKKKATKK